MQHIYVIDKKEDGTVVKSKEYGVQYVPLTDAPKEWRSQNRNLWKENKGYGHIATADQNLRRGKVGVLRYCALELESAKSVQLGYSLCSTRDKCSIRSDRRNRNANYAREQRAESTAAQALRTLGVLPRAIASVDSHKSAILREN